MGTLETEAGRYGMKLNKQKCEYLGMNRATTPRYGRGGAFVKKVTHTKYLGLILSADGTADQEINQRIQQTMATWKRLDKIWKLGKCRIKTRIKYWNAIIRTKLCYAIHTIALTEPQKSKLRAFQMKGLRKILQINTTYINRGNTNARIFSIATQRFSEDLAAEHEARKATKRKKAPKKRKPPKFRDINLDIIDLQVKLLGHTIREPLTECTRQVTFKHGITPFIPPKGQNRVGRTRRHWTLRTMERAWKTAKPRLFKRGYTEGRGKLLLNARTWQFTSLELEAQMMDAAYGKFF